MTEREKTLALLGEAGAKLEVSLSAHYVDEEIFDELPGEARDASSGDRNWRVKSGQFGKLRWNAYTAMRTAAENSPRAAE